MEDEGSRSRVTSAQDVPPSFPELCYHRLLCKRTRLIAQEEASRIHAFNMATSVIKNAEDALCHLLETGYEQANDGLRIALFFCGDSSSQNVLMRHI